jgi:hypothetical protein
MRKLLFLLLCSGLLIACEDVLVEEPTNTEIPTATDEISKEEAEAYFLNDLDGLNFDYNTEESVWIPIWSSAYTYSTDSTDMLEVSLFHVGEGLPDHISRNLLFFRDKGSKGLRSLVKEVIPDTSVVQIDNEMALAEFTGHIIYHDWFEGPLFGYRYLSGEIVSSILDITGGLPSSQNANGRRNKSNGCHVALSYYECTTTWSYAEGGGWSYNGKECDHVNIELNCWGSNTNLANGGNVRTSAGVAVRNLDNNTVNYPSGVILSGSLKPCVTKILQSVMKAIEFRSKIAGMAVNILRKGKAPFNMYKYLQQVYSHESPLVIELGQTKLGKGRNGATAPSSFDRGDKKVVRVFLDSDFLNTATDLAIARVIIHESIHAMMVFGEEELLSENQAFRDANQLLFNPGSNQTKNDIHHSEMANSYVNEIANILESYAIREFISTPKVGRRKYVNYLAYGGLHGTPAWNALGPVDEHFATQVITQENKGYQSSSRNSSC